MKTIGKTINYFENNWLKIMAVTALAIIAIFGTIPHANACEQRTNMQTGQTFLFDCPADLGVPRPVNMYPGGVNLVPVGQQVYGAQNASNINFGNLSTGNLITAGAALVGALNPQGGKGNNRISTALEYGAIAKIGTMIYDKITEPKPQQVALQQVAQVSSQATQTSSGNWCVRAGKKYDCGNNIVVIHNGSPQCLPSAQATESGEEICTGIK